MEEFTVDALGEWESEGGATAQSESGSSPAPATLNYAVDYKHESGHSDHH